MTTLMTSPYDWSSAQSKNEDYAINSFVTPSKCARNYIYVYKMEEKHKKGTVQKNNDMARPSDNTQTDRKNKENNEQHEHVDRDSLRTENYHVIWLIGTKYPFFKCNVSFAFYVNISFSLSPTRLDLTI